MNPEARHRVVVVGGGYAGALAAVRAAGKGRRRLDVTLVDPRARLVQRLRLHQLATGQKVKDYDLRKLTGRRVTNVRGSALELDLAQGLVRVSGSDGARAIPYDTVILATGSTIDLDSVAGVHEFAHSLAGPDAAARLEMTLRHLPAKAVVAVCGGGMTGIEAAAEFAAYRPDLDVKLLTSGRLGAWLSRIGREELAQRLGRLGVDVVEHTRVAALEPTFLTLEDGAEMEVDAAVWCGGFRALSIARDSGLQVDDRGHMVVDPALRSVSHPEVLGIGDAAAIPTLPNGAAYRMTCQAGMPSGAHAADNAVALARGRELKPFDLGWIHQPISLGRRDALIQWVDKADRPKPKVLVGRRAALYKELVTRSPAPTIKLESRLPGALVWRKGGEPIEEGAAAPHTA